MACPTCDHTMQLIGRNEACVLDEWRPYLCPRCGTVKIEDSGADAPILYVPIYADRARSPEALLRLPAPGYLEPRLVVVPSIYSW